VLTALHEGRGDLTVAGLRLQGEALAAAVGAVAAETEPGARVAVVAEPVLETVVAVAGVLAAGACAVPLNPAAGDSERRHVLDDARPDRVLTPADVRLDAQAVLPPMPTDEAGPALIVYTSGTTGPPKGAVLSRRAVAACLDGLAARWEWNADDVLAHALPLFHVHGLVLGVLGPLRIGCRLERTPGFAPVADASIVFGVPTMWARIADADLAAMSGCRLLASGSASLPARVFDRVGSLAGRPLVERYGLTESLIVTAAVPERSAPGRVGTPLPGVGVRIDNADENGLGEVALSGPTLFDGYLNRPGSPLTADGWLRTGDLGRYDDDEGLRLLGRLATDLIKTGGFKVGAGEVEDALLDHPAVAEAAVIGVADDDLGERIVAYVVAADAVAPQTLIDHVAATLAPHKRPREVRFVDELPRNPMGKVQKPLLTR
jgi:acyl-CoA synthetase (AMP-forming)/AMP-acid ligase II